MTEPLDEYVARKKAKGVWGVKKPYKFERRIVRTGICPCKTCDHYREPMILCDPGNADCHCCADVCS